MATSIPSHRDFSTYVLVHGGGHGGWCYQRVARRLRAAGHEVHTPTLTGLGDRAHLLSPEVGLHTHVQDVVSLLFHEDLREVILVGHSYGGAVITGVADKAHDRIAHLVFLDATILLDGECVADASPGIRPFAEQECRRIDGVDLILWPSNPAMRTLYGIEKDRDWSWMESRLHPHPWRCFTDRLELENPDAVASLPRTIINCPATMERRPEEDRHRHLNADRVWEIDTGHDLMITEPGKTTELLLRLAETA